MDPAGLANVEWTQLDKLLINLWCVAGFVVLFAANMLVGYIFIPSLVASFHLPSVAQKVRPLFYLVAVISLAFAVFELDQVIELSKVVLSSFWDDYWI